MQPLLLPPVLQIVGGEAGTAALGEGLFRERHTLPALHGGGDEALDGGPDLCATDLGAAAAGGRRDAAAAMGRADQIRGREPPRRLRREGAQRRE